MTAYLWTSFFKVPRQNRREGPRKSETSQTLRFRQVCLMSRSGVSLWQNKEASVMLLLQRETNMAYVRRHHRLWYDTVKYDKQWTHYTNYRSNLQFQNTAAGGMRSYGMAVHSKIGKKPVQAGKREWTKRWMVHMSHPSYSSARS